MLRKSGAYVWEFGGFRWGKCWGHRGLLFGKSEALAVEIGGLCLGNVLVYVFIFGEADAPGNVKPMPGKLKSDAREMGNVFSAFVSRRFLWAMVGETIGNWLGKPLGIGWGDRWEMA